MSQKSSYLEKDERSDETPKDIPPHLHKLRMINDQLSSHALSSATETEMFSSPWTGVLTKLFSMPAWTKTWRGGSEEGSNVTKFWRLRCDTAGRELCLAILVFHSKPWNEVGFTQIEGFLVRGLSPPSTELEGREGALDDEADSNPPLWTTKSRSPLWTEIKVLP